MMVRRFAVQVKSYEAERACGLTFQVSDRHVDACETRAAREGIKRPCGPEKSKYRQRCQGVQVSDGLGGQGFKLAISRPRGAGTDLRGHGSPAG